MDATAALHKYREYFHEFLPGLLNRLLIEDLKNLSCSFAYRVPALDEPTWRLIVERGRLTSIRQDGPEPECCFVCDIDALLEVVSAAVLPQDAFFDMRIEIEGDIELGLKLSTVLAPFFARYPFDLSKRQTHAG